MRDKIIGIVTVAMVVFVVGAICGALLVHRIGPAEIVINVPIVDGYPAEAEYFETEVKDGVLIIWAWPAADSVIWHETRLRREE